MANLLVAAVVGLLTFTLAPLDVAAYQRVLPYKFYNFTTKVDHFSYRNNATFQMRYVMVHKFWKNRDGPILFYPGNEMAIESFVHSTGIMWEMGKLFRALLIFAEHRYYGQSLPFGNDSFKHMTCLSSEQAMADYVDLLTWLKGNLPGAQNRDVVTFGGSYGGMLAAWMRMKYPHIVNAALASSAPFRMFPGLGSCDRYYTGVTQAFEKSSSGCRKLVSRTWPVLDKLGSTPEGCKTLEAKFRTCHALEPSNYPEFRDWIRDTYSILATINYPYGVTLLGPIPAHPVKAVCNILSSGVKTEENTVDAVANAMNLVYNGTGKSPCNNVYRTANMHAYRFQECTELIHPTCSDGVKDMFYPQEWDPEKFAERCRKRFGVTPEFDRMTKKYPITDFNMASYIIFSDGDMDPWAVYSLEEAPNKRTRRWRIEGAVHHADLQFPHPDEPRSYKYAREFAINTIGLMWEWARDFKALLVFPEHRYYGGSLPFGKDSFKAAKTTAYLTTEQALADYLDLVVWLKNNIKGAQNSRVAAFGGHHAAMLATWFRTKYPHTVRAALASSAPFKMFSQATKCNTYYKAVTAVYKKTSKLCPNEVKRLWPILNGLGSTVWRKNKHIESCFQVVCNRLRKSERNNSRLIDAAVEAVGFFRNATGKNACYTVPPTPESSAWLFQQCTEFALPLCGDGVADMFYPTEWDYVKFYQKCGLLFGVTSKVDRLVQAMGGANLCGTSKVFFTNGDFDPWSAYGVEASPTRVTEYRVIRGGAHCLDLRFSNDRWDPHSLRLTRRVAKRAFRRWLAP
ncbi:lysosomal Pro-X carboxypeptidase-like [Dermacentor variabilis]|uniref:lysosomal Pro-X carboxypeptidase-like n=1 Tax=Dermacentor variabilis TaxID=34621 RepID=UPI003F5B3FEC